MTEIFLKLFYSFGMIFFILFILVGIGGQIPDWYSKITAGAFSLAIASATVAGISYIWGL